MPDQTRRPGAPGIPGLRLPRIPNDKPPRVDSGPPPPPPPPPQRDRYPVSWSPAPTVSLPPTESKRIAAVAANSPWFLLIITVGKWVAATAAPFLAGGALWLYSEIEKQKAEATKLRAEAEAIVDARKLLDNDQRKLRECMQKVLTWLPQDDRLDRGVFAKLGASIEGAPEYTDVEFKPAPLTKGIKRDAAPPVQPVDSLPAAPECEF